MDNKIVFKAFTPILVIFTITSGILVAFPALFTKMKIDANVMLVGNLILFIATLISFYFYYRSLRNNRVAVFLRLIYGAMFIKMMICLVTAFVYIMMTGKNVNKGAIFGCMFLYLVYTFIEVAVLMKLSKQNKNA
jgi:hypothetical protein